MKKMNRLLKIIKHYGIEHQQRKFNEEVFELQEAITTYEMTEIDMEHIAEEIADCEVLLGQFKVYYDIPNCTITRFKEFKIDRQLKRMEDEAQE